MTIITITLIGMMILIYYFDHLGMSALEAYFDLNIYLKLATSTSYYS